MNESAINIIAEINEAKVNSLRQLLIHSNDHDTFIQLLMLIVTTKFRKQLPECSQGYPANWFQMICNIIPTLQCLKFENLKDKLEIIDSCNSTGDILLWCFRNIKIKEVL